MNPQRSALDDTGRWDARASSAASGPPATAPAFSWWDERRFVDVFAVQTGWLVIWGSVDEDGYRSMHGNRIYCDAEGVRDRLAAAVFVLTADRGTVDQALSRYDREGLPQRDFVVLPDLD